MLRPIALTACLILIAASDSRKDLVRGDASAAQARVKPAATAEVRPATVEQILAAVREPGSKAVLVNVWATWCVPCREEFPDLLRLRNTYRVRGLKLVLVSADLDDQLDDTKRFLARQRVDFVTYLKQGDDMRFIQTMDRRWSGALPATFLYDDQRRLRYFREGRTSYAVLEKELRKILIPNKPSKEDAS